MKGLKAMIKPQSWKGSIRQKQYNTWKANHYGGVKEKETIYFTIWKGNSL